ncbi:MAG: UbiH/UbiF family hydroxylase [Rhodobacteraceae bacterium]|nr:UbiH/UbiF family hydroxylase [Paracoccaceae bacterium]
MSETRFDYDILIAGGGLAGMSAAAAFGQSGFSVLCVDPVPPVTERDTIGADLRTTAILQPSRDFLDEIGLWDRFDAEAAPLQIMRIVDAGGVENTPRVIKNFDAADLGERPFGWNLSNWFLRRGLSAHLAEMPQVDMRFGSGVTRVQTRTEEGRVSLSDGSRHRVRLVIGADGRGSAVRRDAAIGARTMRYGQKALAFAATHAIPHEHVSTEIHRSGGPFTLVPLPDYDGRPCSAVVWLERAAEAQRLHGLDEEAFNAEMSERSCHLFGPLTLVSRRTIWPIISQIADSFHGERIALVAEAAHVMPPIGAQGLNTSIGDIRALHRLATATPDRLGDADMLARYTRARWAEVQLRVAGIDALNRASMVETQGLRDLRKTALDTLYGIAPVRKVLMRTGLGALG